MKVLKIAFGHPDNVLSLCANLATKVELTLVFVVCGEKFQQGVLNIDLKGLDYGLHTGDTTFKRAFPEPIVNFVGGRFQVWVLKVPSRKLLDIKNFHIFWKAIRRLKKEKIDVVHYNGYSPYIYLFYQRFKFGPAQFWTLHDYKNHSGEKNAKAERINRMLAGLSRLTVIQHYEYLRKKVIEEFNLPAQKVRTLLCGPLDIFHSFLPKNTLCPADGYILFFGRASAYKGIDVLLEAYTQIPSPKLHLVVAGKGNYWFDPAPYEKDPNIHFFNTYIENEELAGLIQQSQFIVVPYRDATHSAVIATAYGMNKPVVASDVDGLNEVVSDGLTGRLVRPGSPHSLQAVLEDLFRAPEKLKVYAANIEKEKENGKIAWSTIINEYVALYSEKRRPA